MLKPKHDLITTGRLLILAVIVTMTNTVRVEAASSDRVNPFQIVVVDAGAHVFQPGPYYPYPSWDQQLPASTRFIVLTNWGNQAVLDRETGLVWQRAPDASAANNLREAIVLCRGVLTGGRAGWRLPTQEELATLVDPTQSNPPLPAGHPFQGIAAGDQFWTASTFEFANNVAYFIEFSTADLVGLNTDIDSAAHRRWCVRGGSGAQDPTFAPQ